VWSFGVLMDEVLSRCVSMALSKLDILNFMKLCHRLMWSTQPKYAAAPLNRDRRQTSASAASGVPSAAAALQSTNKTYAPPDHISLPRDAVARAEGRNADRYLSFRDLASKSKKEFYLQMAESAFARDKGVPLTHSASLPDHADHPLENPHIVGASTVSGIHHVTSSVQLLPAGLAVGMAVASVGSFPKSRGSLPPLGIDVHSAVATSAAVLGASQSSRLPYLDMTEHDFAFSNASVPLSLSSVPAHADRMRPPEGIGTPSAILSGGLPPAHVAVGAVTSSANALKMLGPIGICVNSAAPAVHGSLSWVSNAIADRRLIKANHIALVDRGPFGVHVTAAVRATASIVGTSGSTIGSQVEPAVAENAPVFGSHHSVPCTQPMTSPLGHGVHVHDLEMTQNNFAGSIKSVPLSHAARSLPVPDPDLPTQQPKTVSHLGESSAVEISSVPLPPTGLAVGAAVSSGISKSPLPPAGLGVRAAASASTVRAARTSEVNYPLMPQSAFSGITGDVPPSGVASSIPLNDNAHGSFATSAPVSSVSLGISLPPAGLAIGATAASASSSGISKFKLPPVGLGTTAVFTSAVSASGGVVSTRLHYPDLAQSAFSNATASVQLTHAGSSPHSDRTNPEAIAPADAPLVSGSTAAIPSGKLPPVGLAVGVADASASSAAESGKSFPPVPHGVPLGEAAFASRPRSSVGTRLHYPDMPQSAFLSSNGGTPLAMPTIAAVPSNLIRGAGSTPIGIISSASSSLTSSVKEGGKHESPGSAADRVVQFDADGYVRPPDEFDGYTHGLEGEHRDQAIRESQDERLVMKSCYSAEQLSAVFSQYVRLPQFEDPVLQVDLPRVLRWCCRWDPRERPDMAYVAETLRKLLRE
jgi:hypothetical protein